MSQMLHKFACRLFKDYALSLRFDFFHTRPKRKVDFILKITKNFINKKYKMSKRPAGLKSSPFCHFHVTIFSNARVTIE